MRGVRAWLFCFLALFISWHNTEAEPQCLDGGLPFDAGTELDFCTEFSHYGCCREYQDSKLSQGYGDLEKHILAESWETCSGYFKNFLCQSCSPYASHLFGYKSNEFQQSFINHRLFPGLCPNYCKKFVQECGQVILFYADYMVKKDPELAGDAMVLKYAFQNSTEAFCNIASLADSRYCVQETLEEKISDAEALTPDRCLCAQKMGDKDLKDVLIMTHANDDSNRMFVVEETGVGHIMYPNGEFHPEPFFDIRNRAAQFVGKGGKEPSALGMAFHPKFKDNGLFYLYFTKSINKANGKRMNSLGEFKVLDSDQNKTDPGYFRLILDVYQQSYDNPGGQVVTIFTSLIICSQCKT